MTMTMKDTKYPRHEQKKNSATAHMKGEHHDAELAHGDEAANARDDEGHEVPEVRGEWKFYHRAYER